jgi:transposase InsO family protein
VSPPCGDHRGPGPPVGIALVVPALDRRRLSAGILSGAALAAAGTAFVEGSAGRTFWESLKRECVQGRVFAIRAEARRAIFKLINYNASRLHSTLNDVAPLEWEQRYRQAS